MGIRTRTSPSKTSTVLMLVGLLSRSGGFMPAARWSNGIAPATSELGDAEVVPAHWKGAMGLLWSATGGRVP
jgi:hypothetical protein